MGHEAKNIEPLQPSVRPCCFRRKRSYLGGCRLRALLQTTTMPDSAKPDSPLGENSPAPIREEFLRMLRCPDSRQPLSIADESLLAALNSAISAGKVKNVGGESVAEIAQTALIREDGQFVYTIIGRIPRLTKEEGIAVSQFTGK